MLDANDIQIISKIVSEAIAENNKVIREDMAAALVQQKKEIHEDMAAALVQQKKEIREDMAVALAQQKKEIREDMAAALAKQKREIHEDFMTIIESEVNPKLQILAEGHEVLLEMITPANEIEAMKADIVVLKEAVQHLSARLNAMQKAQ